MSNENWQDFDHTDDDELIDTDRKNKFKSNSRKRKWREIESIKEQRRLRRDLAEYEQYSY